MTRKVCVITGSRAEYGHIQWLMKDIKDDPRLQLQIIITGMHMEPAFGNTYQEIEQDDHVIDRKIPVNETDDSVDGIATSMAMALRNIAVALTELSPDIVVLLGDRFEVMAAAQAAMLNRIPIAHLHGGETTEGAMDESMRHSITKMSHLHFVAAEDYRRRVIQLGESPERIFNFGAPGLCALNRTVLPNREQLEQSINFELGENYFLVTYHPVTLSDDDEITGISNLLAALDNFKEFKIVITAVNADIGNKSISDAYKKFVSRNNDRVLLVDNLGHQRYLSALKYSSVCLGNSSSGIIEAPALNVPTVNIGIRQKGRLRAESVIDCDDSKEGILDALHQALSPDFKKQYQNQIPPYGAGNASEKIKNILAEADLSDVIVKSFYDIDVS